jgi:hemerythrin-like domain-containing protein
VHPLDRLHEDHLVFRDRFSGFESRLDAMANSRRLDAGALAAFHEDLRFFRERLLTHFRAEDDTILPAMERHRGRHGTSLVDILALEHEELRRAVRKIADAVQASDVDELNRHGLFLVQVLQDHVRKEETVFFPGAREAIPETEWAEIAALLGSLPPGGSASER